MSRRYEPQRRLPGWDQERLLHSTALIVGVGGLGSPAALYLAAMGIGRLLLVDADTVEEINLHRQPLYSPSEIGQRKVDVLAHALQRLRPDLEVEKHPAWANQPFLEQVGAAADIWIDGTDNLPSRLTLDEVAYRLGKPWVYGAIYQWEGHAALLHGVRYKDFFGEGVEGPACSEAGVLGGIPGVIGSLQASLAAMYLSSPDAVPVGRLFRVDLRNGDMSTFSLGLPTELPLEISFAQARQLEGSYWIFVGEALPESFPVQVEPRPWYAWDRWQLPESPLVLICEAGNRSRQIAFALRKKTGRKDIYSLAGGWQQFFT